MKYRENICVSKQKIQGKKEFTSVQLDISIPEQCFQTRFRGTQRFRRVFTRFPENAEIVLFWMFMFRQIMRHFLEVLLFEKVENYCSRKSKQNVSSSRSVKWFTLFNWSLFCSSNLNPLDSCVMWLARLSSTLKDLILHKKMWKNVAMMQLFRRHRFHALNHSSFTASLRMQGGFIVNRK